MDSLGTSLVSCSSIRFDTQSFPRRKAFVWSLSALANKAPNDSRSLLNHPPTHTGQVQLELSSLRSVPVCQRKRKRGPQKATSRQSSLESHSQGYKDREVGPGSPRLWEAAGLDQPQHHINPYCIVRNREPYCGQLCNRP